MAVNPADKRLGHKKPVKPQAAPKPWLPESWDYEADVVIIGYGGAGACAAIASYDAGAKPLVLEKAPFGGGNTATAGPGFAVPKDIDKGREYYRALTFGQVDEKLIDTLTEAIHGLPEWLRELGADPRLVKLKTHYPTLPGADGFVNLHLPRTQKEAELQERNVPGEQLFNLFAGNVAKRKIEILYQTPVNSLIQDPLTREILGVRATNPDGKEISIKAKKAVVLACGGFENNREMLTQFMPYSVQLPIFPLGTPYNTGDGITMATEVGAKLWHMTSVELSIFAPRIPAEKFGVGMRLSRQIPQGSTVIFINKYGQRFMNESVLLSHSREFFKVQDFDAGRAEFPNIPFYMLFDETYRKRGPIVSRGESYWSLHEIYKWSQDNSAEIEAGWIEKADSIRQLAEKIKVPGPALAETISRYNEGCSKGEDSEFGRGKEWLAPLEAPFYATELIEPIINTQGGPKHNANSQVLDKSDKPIPRLYAAGELGSVWFPLYQPGSNIPETFCFGRIAGQHAAGLKPWK